MRLKNNWLIICFISLVLAISGLATGHEADVPFAEWMMSLHEPDNPVASCCGLADQFYVDEYYPSTKDPTGFVAVVNGESIEIPGEKVIWDRVNPTGRGVVFLSKPEEWNESEPFVYCFVPSSGV